MSCTKLFNILPAVIITSAICFIAETPVAIVSFLLVYPIWAILEISISERISGYNDARKKLSKILKGLNISKRQWRKYSDSEKDKYRSYYTKQESIKKRIVYKRYTPSISRMSSKKELIKAEVEKEWENFSLQKRIEIIEKNELKNQEEKRKREEERKKWNELYKEGEKAILEFEELEKEWKKEDLKEREEEEIRIKKNEKRKQREAERQLKIKKEQEKEELKQIEEIKQKKLLEERKEQENKRYKEYIKRQIREK